ncbi:hypothetical protein BVY03_04850 [bacterium K02(2017)]|nr:hypothetical protein BVY03_04850 [bacterium K02(2017)]
MHPNSKKVLAAILLVILFIMLLLRQCGTEFIIPEPRDSLVKFRKSPPLLGVHVKDLVQIKDFPELQGKQGLRVFKIMMDSIAHEAGILVGDIILEYDQENFDLSSPNQASGDFRNYIYEQKNVGDPFKLKIYRINTSFTGQKGDELLDKETYESSLINQIINEQKPGDKLDLQINKEGQILEMTVELGRRPNFRSSPPPSNAELYPEFETQNPSYQQLVQSLIDHYDINSKYKDLIDRYDRDEWWDDDLRNGLFRYVHRDPFKLPVVANDLTDKIESHTQLNGFKTLALQQLLARSLDEAITEPTHILTPPKSTKVKKHFEFISNILQESILLRDTAIVNLNQEDLDFLYSHLSDMSGKYIHANWNSNSSADDYDNFQRFLSLAKKIDFQALFSSAQIFYQLNNPEWIQSFTKALLKYTPTDTESKNPGSAQGDVFMVRDTEWGQIIIGGPGKTIYQHDIKFIFDLGGDDFYRNNAGAARTAAMPLSFVIDLNGNDQYSDTKAATQATGFLGNGLLIDLKGNDEYIATQLSQGVGLLGNGLLIDYEGNDFYNGQEYAQGVGFWGIGTLVDLKGIDRYRGNYFVQGVGGPKGFGLLYDIDGNDHYYATGRYKSSYGTQGIYSGMSQGLGFGIRQYASGGIGVLIDSAGADIFNAGNFSQGGGYYFGLGILKNSGDNNDEYRGSRYSQGFSAHSAAGILIDDAGNDTYIGKVTALQASAWDLGAAALIDKQGDDFYDSYKLGFAQGASAHNGFALFLDYSGKDSYALQDGQQGSVPDNSYHKGSSLAIFIDAGGQSDLYNQKTELNNQIIQRDEYGFFIDLNTTINKSLDDKSFEDLILETD